MLLAPITIATIGHVVVSNKVISTSLSMPRASHGYVVTRNMHGGSTSTGKGAWDLATLRRYDEADLPAIIAAFLSLVE